HMSVILDTKGEPVSNAADAYYLVPVSHGEGGLALAKVGNEAEPKAVVLDPHHRPGLTVRFETPLAIAIITESFFLNIKFVPSSSDSEVWDVSKQYPIGLAVKVTDTKSFVGPFRVEKEGEGYKIVYYPDRGQTGLDIGLVHRNDKYYLAATEGEPFVFKIRKATYE
uniref:Kunitz-type proteinase inhibitor BbCI n=1 Tax=Bauhinia bauhinioides TaxID=166014 RepID=UPI000158A167|nr:Chain A, Kunitz-type proteinase inhibitor BbCI [Bauhinia bauhinioides]2GZB_B Chain B, Kunitz-type proteinase inhibitor BbCI [Bauhinia bauhinioides]